MVGQSGLFSPHYFVHPIHNRTVGIYFTKHIALSISTPSIHLNFSLQFWKEIFCGVFTTDWATQI